MPSPRPTWAGQQRSPRDSERRSCGTASGLPRSLDELTDLSCDVQDSAAETKPPRPISTLAPLPDRAHRDPNGGRKLLDSDQINCRSDIIACRFGCHWAMMATFGCFCQAG